MQEWKRRKRFLFAAMTGLVTALLVPLALHAQGAISQSERPRPLGWALDAASRGNWEMAHWLARRDGPIASDIIEWQRLRAGEGTADEVRAFVSRRPDWPGMTLLRRNSEAAFEGATSAQILSFFGTLPAQTAQGALIHASALRANGQNAAAQSVIQTSWVENKMSAQTQALYLEAFENSLRNLHWDRAKAMLNQRRWSDAERMVELLTTGQASITRARLAVQRGAPEASRLVAALSSANKQGAGLNYDRFVARVTNGPWSEAKSILLERSKSQDMLGQPELWANHRRALARDEMRDGDPRRAYEMASQHFLSKGAAYADLEWLSGYIALRFLNRPSDALRHFEAHRAAITSPISRGRAGYWLGRAYEELKNRDAAIASYRDGALFQTSFYGLLSAERLAMGADPALAGTEEFTDWRKMDFAQSDLFEAAMLAQASGALSLSERFILKLASSMNRSEAGSLGQAMIEWQQPHLAVMVGKNLAQRGATIHAPYYPLHPMAQANLGMAPEMVLAIARRESEFDPFVQSPAGALGLMQLMPRTANETAAKAGISGHSTKRLTEDPNYNAQLGARYLRELSGRYGGNLVLISVAYNAGPSRADRWIELYGDPRNLPANFDIIDWIEHIPFRETRNYVMRVTESLPVYRARLGRPALTMPFSSELQGDSLRRYAIAQ